MTAESTHKAKVQGWLSLSREIQRRGSRKAHYYVGGRSLCGLWTATIHDVAAAREDERCVTCLEIQELSR
jgi:hypothetical protein